MTTPLRSNPFLFIVLLIPFIVALLKLSVVCAKQAFARPTGSTPPSTGRAPSKAARPASQPSGRLRTATRRSWDTRSRAARAVRAWASPRSARSRAPVGRMRGSARTGRRRDGGRQTIAADSRTSGSAAAICSIPSGSGDSPSRQIRPRDATARVRHVGREALLAVAAPRRWRPATGRGARPVAEIDQQRGPVRRRRRRRQAPRPRPASRSRRRPGHEDDREDFGVARYPNPSSASPAHLAWPRGGRGGDGEPVGERRQRRGRRQAHRDAAALDRDVDVVVGPARQRFAGGRRPPADPRPAPAPPPRRRRRRASARSRRRAAAGRAAPASSSAGRAATSSTVAWPSSLPIRHAQRRPRPDRQPRQRRAAGAGSPPGPRRAVPIAHLRPRAQRRSAAPGAPPPPHRPRPAPPAPRPAPPRRPTTAPARRAPSCAATRTASSRNGTTAISSTEAVPSSLRELLAAWRDTPRPSQRRDARVARSNERIQRRRLWAARRQ